MRRHTRPAARPAAVAIAAGLAAAFPATGALAEDRVPATTTGAALVRSGTVTIDGLDIFYREAGPRETGAPSIVLLHGFPTSSHMFRDLIPLLADRFHVIAPDYPGYGLSDAPPAEDYEYTFDNAADVVEELLHRKKVDEWVLYLQDYGAPVGFRLAVGNPGSVAGLIIQNGNAYEEGLPDSFWGPWRDYWADKNDQEAIEYLAGLLTLESTTWQFTHGTRNPDAISPDNWLVVQPLLDRPGNAAVQLEYAYDYGTNLARYPVWQEYLREHQPPTLITWGRHDEIFPPSGAFPYLRDLPHAELHLLDTGHFALEEDGERIAAWIREFIERRVIPSSDADG